MTEKKCKKKKKNEKGENLPVFFLHRYNFSQREKNYFIEFHMVMKNVETSILQIVHLHLIQKNVRFFLI